MEHISWWRVFLHFRLSTRACSWATGELWRLRGFCGPVEWEGDGAQKMADTGTFPALKKILTSDSFTDPTTDANKKTNDYFGGQNVNEILAEAARRPA